MGRPNLVPHLASKFKLPHLDSTLCLLYKERFNRGHKCAKQHFGKYFSYMRTRRMAAISSFDPRLSTLSIGRNQQQKGVVMEEIEGLIKVYKDGHVERPPIVPNVACTVARELDLSCKDVVIDKVTNVWARFYVPNNGQGKLPLLVYFHGGGFCVGSAAWICYHELLSKLASKTGSVIISVNYRLAPENRLPAAYEDGLNALNFLKQQAIGSNNDQRWWTNRCNFSRVFLAGDSAGANIAYNVSTRVTSGASLNLNPLILKGIVLVQPFFGGEARTHSERFLMQPPNSALNLTASDAYWKLSLPLGSNRDNPWCNPLANKSGSNKLGDMRLPPTMVCISEMDILKDRSLEFCNAMRKAGKSVECVMSMGVGHAFQILNNYQNSQTRTQEMTSQIKAFINNNR